MSEKILSISIAAYNTGLYIEEAVRSLLIEKQWLDKIEIIIVNDGSKDNTSNIAHKLQQENPDSIIVIDKLNGGFGSTINSSLEVARGKYYKLLDGDDWYDTRVLADYINYLEKSEADLVISPYTEVRESEICIDNHSCINSEFDEICSAHLGEKLFLNPEMAIKTNILREYGKTIAEHCFYTDAEYVFYCIAATKTISRFDKPVYRYRLGTDGQSVSLKGIRAHFRDLPTVAERIFADYCEKASLLTDGKKDVLDLCVTYITFHAYRAYMLMEKPQQYKNELIQFDKEVAMKFPKAYALGYKSRLVYVVRKLHFALYSLLCRYALKRFVSENTGC